jgi:hypothetical protein
MLVICDVALWLKLGTNKRGPDTCDMSEGDLNTETGEISRNREIM